MYLVNPLEHTKSLSDSIDRPKCFMISKKENDFKNKSSGLKSRFGIHKVNHNSKEISSSALCKNESTAASSILGKNSQKRKKRSIVFKITIKNKQKKSTIEKVKEKKPYQVFEKLINQEFRDNTCQTFINNENLDYFDAKLNAAQVIFYSFQDDVKLNDCFYSDFQNKLKSIIFNSISKNYNQS